MVQYVEESLCIKNYKIYQSKDLYRFTSDAVLLSRFAKGGAAIVADICSGSGIVGIHYYALHDDTTEAVTLCELQSELAKMSEASVRLNGLEDKFTVICGRAQDMTEREKYDLVLCNPPYKKRGSGVASKTRSLDICRKEEEITLDEAVCCASKLLKRGGAFCVCNAVDRLQDAFLAFDKHKIYPSRMRLVSAHEGESPYLFLLEGIKGKRINFTVESQVVNSAKDFSGE